jgi:hypothetical protein
MFPGQLRPGFLLAAARAANPDAASDAVAMSGLGGQTGAARSG